MAGGQWIAGFDYPSYGWKQLDVWAKEGAERAAQEIADRGGELNMAYAKALCPEFKLIRQGAMARNATPVVVFVPELPLQSRPLIPVTAFVAPWNFPEQGCTLEAVIAMAREPQPYRVREPVVSEIRLPVGLSVRVHEVVVEETGDDERRVVTEYISYYVIPPGYLDGIVEMTVTWTSPGIGPEMVQTADEMATTLRVERRK